MSSPSVSLDKFVAQMASSSSSLCRWGSADSAYLRPQNLLQAVPGTRHRNLPILVPKSQLVPTSMSPSLAPNDLSPALDLYHSCHILKSAAYTTNPGHWSRTSSQKHYCAGKVKVSSACLQSLMLDTIGSLNLANWTLLLRPSTSPSKLPLQCPHAVCTLWMF